MKAPSPVFFFLRLLALICLICPLGAWPEALGFYDDPPPDYEDPLFRRSQELTSRNRGFLNSEIQRAAEEALINIKFYVKSYPPSYYPLFRTGFFLSENIAVTGFEVIEGLIDNDDSELDFPFIQVTNFQGDDLKLKRIIAMSAVHNLAVLEIEGYTGRPLEFASQSDFKDSYENILIAGVFQKRAIWLRGKNASSRSFLWHWFSEVLWTDPNSFASRSELIGSPALAANGKAVGLISEIDSNFITGIRDKYILELLGKEPLPLKRPKALLKEEFSRLRDMAESGDSFAQLKLGQQLIDRARRLREEGFEEGMQWLRRAAESGNERAMEILGILLIEKFTDEALQEGYEMISRAAAAGLPGALHNFGLLLQNGAGTDKNEEEAIRWFEASAKLGSIESKRKLAETYFLRKTHEDNRKALEWMFEGAAIGDPLLQYHAGIMFYKGSGVEKNRNETLRWLILAGKSLPGARYHLSEILSERSGWANQFEALKWYNSSNEMKKLRPRILIEYIPFPLPEKINRSFILKLSRTANEEVNISTFERYLYYLMNKNEEHYTISPNWGIGSYGREIYNDDDDRTEPPEITFEQADRGYVAEIISRRRIQMPEDLSDIGNVLTISP